jgi:hypothetical protein
MQSSSPFLRVAIQPVLKRWYVRQALMPANDGAKSRTLPGRLFGFFEHFSGTEHLNNRNGKLPLHSSSREGMEACVIRLLLSSWI